jgi:hypothetical protein
MFKVIMKYLNSEKSDELKVESAYCLYEFLYDVDAAFIAPHYETILATLFKKLEETNDWILKKLFSDCISSLFLIACTQDIKFFIL